MTAQMTAPMITENILNDIQTLGFSVQEKFLSPENLNNLRNVILNAYHNNSSDYILSAAGVGRNGDLQKNVRGDKIHWLTKENLNPSQKIVWDFLETLRGEFNQKLFFGLKDFEVHVTVYPENTFYKKHIDQFKNSNIDKFDKKVRKISFIIYLNKEWLESDGGALRLFDFNDQEKIVKTILPQGGRAVFFLSEDFPHEVLETKKERVSITGWFYT